MIRIQPHDEWNETLIRNVHPADWKNPQPAARYDLVAVGAGAAGLISAAGAAGLGAKAALIERGLLGGDCLNVGCVPSKSLLRSAHVAAEARDAGRFGVEVGSVAVDFGAVMRRMRQVRARISPVDSAARYSGELGVDVFLGEARFTSPTTIDVDGVTLAFKKAVVATGARPAVPPVPGLSEAGYLTNETIFELTELPRRLLVMGGGPIGCEMSQAFRRFGAEVTLVEMAPQFLGREDPDAAAVLRRAFERDGVDVRLGTTVARVGAGDGRGKVVTLETAGGTEDVVVDEILVAAGRSPNVEGMGLEQAGVEYDPRQGVVVDDHLRTSNRRVFAAGDVCLRTQFTHAAEFAARTVIQNALLLPTKKMSALTIPWCTYTSPEIAHVGLSARDADARGIPIDTWRHELADLDRAIAEGDTEGFVKIHTRKGRDEILGATIVARHAGDLISEISVAMAGRVGLGGLTAVIHPYPTQADAIRQAANAYNRSRLTPGIKRLFETVIRLRR